MAIPVYSKTHQFMGFCSSRLSADLGRIPVDWCACDGWNPPTVSLQPIRRGFCAHQAPISPRQKGWSRRRNYGKFDAFLAVGWFFRIWVAFGWAEGLIPASAQRGRGGGNVRTHLRSDCTERGPFWSPNVTFCHAHGSIKISVNPDAFLAMPVFVD